MRTLRTIINWTARPGGSRFDRYYGGVIRSGAGYPTADEARRDMHNARRSPFEVTR